MACEGHSFNCSLTLNSNNCSIFKLMELSNEDGWEGIIKNLRSFNYLPNCDIKKLIQKDFTYCDRLHHNSITLFQNVRLPSDPSKIDSSHISVLFSFIKKNFSLLRSATVPNSGGYTCRKGGFGEGFEGLRDSITDCLDYLKRLLFSVYLNGKGNCLEDYELCLQIVGEMKNLVMFVGRLGPQFERHCRSYHLMFGTRDERQTALYHYFHASLQIWWTMIEITYIVRLETRFNFSELYLLKEDSFSDLFTQSLRIFLYDLLLMTVHRYNEALREMFGIKYLFVTPFSCSCMMEIIVMLRMLLSHLGNEDDDEDHLNLDRFYKILFETISYFDPKNTSQVAMMKSDQFNYLQYRTIVLEGFLVENHQQYFIWIWANLVPLLSVDLVADGLMVKHDSRVKVTVPPLVVKLYRDILKQLGSSGTDHDRTALCQVRVVSTMLAFTTKYSQFLSTVSFDLLIIFLEYFLKRLNTNFNLVQSSALSLIENYDYTVKSGERWAKVVTDIVTTRVHFFKNDNCLNIFLLYMSNQIARLFESVSTVSTAAQRDRFVTINFQKFISKVVVSLQPGLLKSLNGMGFYNLSLFYLTLIRTIPSARWCDLCDKMLSLYRDISKEAKGKQTIETIIKYLSSILHLRPEVNEANQKVAGALSKLFTGIVQDDRRRGLSHADYLSVVWTYFAELDRLLSKKLNNNHHPLLLFYLDELVNRIDLGALFGSLHSISAHPADLQPVCEFLTELLQVIVRLVQRVEREESGPSPSVVDGGSEGTLDLDQVVRHTIRLIEHIAGWLQSELLACGPAAEMIASVSFHLTLLTLTLNNRYSPMFGAKLKGLQLVQNLLSGESIKLDAAFQLDYLHQLFEDYLVISRFREETTSELSDLLVASWCRLLVVTEPKSQAKLHSLSKSIARMYLELESECSSVGSSSPDLDPTPDQNVSLSFFERYLVKLSRQLASPDGLNERSQQLQSVNRRFRWMITSAHHLLGSRKWTGSEEQQWLVNIMRQVALMVQHCARHLYIVGKSDCLLAVILENLVILPPTCHHLLTSRTTGNVILKVSFPMIFEGLCRFPLDSDPYIERKTRQIIVSYLPALSQMVTAQCIKTTFVSRDIYKYWKIYLTRVLEKTYLVQREPPMQRELADYLNQFCQHELSQENLKRFSIIILRQNSFNVFIAGPKDCRNTLFHTIISKAVVTFNEDSELTKFYIESLLGPFIRANLQSRPAKLFEVLRSLLPRTVHHICPLMFHELCSEVTRQLDDIERRSVSGGHMVLRKLFKDFIAYYERITSD